MNSSSVQCRFFSLLLHSAAKVWLNVARVLQQTVGQHFKSAVGEQDHIILESCQSRSLIGSDAETILCSAVPVVYRLCQARSPYSQGDLSRCTVLYRVCQTDDLVQI